MRRWAWCCGLLCIACLPAVASAGEAGAECRGEPECRRAVVRLENAYRSGRREAATLYEAYESLLVRNARLTGLVEETYASTLAWLAGRGDLTDALQADQARWLAEVRMAEAILGAPLERRIAAQEIVSELLLERLRMLAAITAADSLILSF